MFRKTAWVWSALFVASAAWADSEKTAADLLEALQRAGNQKGIQVGLIINAHKSDSSAPYAELVTLPGGEGTAYDALQGATISKRYHPQYKTPPMVMVLSLMGEAPDRTSDGQRSWAFFLGQIDGGNVKWTLSDKGVAQAPVGDGSLIGFSRTAWIKKGVTFQAKDEPRISTNK